MEFRIFTGRFYFALEDCLIESTGMKTNLIQTH